MGVEDTVSVDRNVKVWIFISLCSLLVWIIRWMSSGFKIIYNLIFVSLYYYEANWVYFSAFAGMIARIIGVVLGVCILCFVWNRVKSSLEIRKWVATALALEAVYFALLFPSSLRLLSRGYSILGVAYLLQTIFTTPFLALLAFKVYKWEGGSKGFEGGKWVGITFVCYIAALWVNSVFRWIDMLLAEGVAFFFSGINGVGMLNAFVFMSLAVVFAVVGTYSLVKQQKGSILKWWGLALAMVGFHYLVYVVFSYYVGMLAFAWLIDVWAIPLLGLGLAMLKTKTNTKKTPS